VLNHHKDAGARSMAGRRFYFVGIGGSGMSAYANAARALGAEVRGWDVRETIFMETLEGVEIDLGGEPSPPEGWEVVVSTAHAARIHGTSRAAFLSELVSARRSIVVAGAHGKTTTAGMIAFGLREAGADPGWIIGGVIPQLGGNAGAGSGWLVVEGDESDRSLFALRPRIAVVTNVELDHHATYASEAELRSELDSWLAGVPEVVRAWTLDPVGFELAVPGEHNRTNAAAALEALALAGVDRDVATAALARFTGAGRRFELVGERGGVTVYDDYGHNPTELRVTLATARERTRGKLIAVYQPHVYERTRHLAQELADALGLADVAIVTEVTGARDEPRDGVSGRWVLERLPPHVRAGWAPTLDGAAALALHMARPGDAVVTFGVGEPWKVARAIVEGLPA
jgi:UDP-N-acetylmuramate--alanine ligase